MFLSNSDLPRGFSEAELEFGLNVGGLVTEAAVTFDGEDDVAWPLQPLNDALAHVYGFYVDSPQIGVPQIYPIVSSSGQQVGFIVRPRADWLSEGELWDAFWGILEANDVADGSTLSFRLPTPFMTTGVWDDVDVAIVAYPVPYGPGVPVQPVNEALFEILSQRDFDPEIQQVFLYPVSRGASPLVSGIWLTQAIDDVVDDQLMDDMAVRNIHQSNRNHQAQRACPGFSSRRYYL